MRVFRRVFIKTSKAGFYGAVIRIALKTCFGSVFATHLQRQIALISAPADVRNVVFVALGRGVPYGAGKFSTMHTRKTSSL
jgi:hypothetical protein